MLSGRFNRRLEGIRRRVDDRGQIVGDNDDNEPPSSVARWVYIRRCDLVFLSYSANESMNCQQFQKPMSWSVPIELSAYQTVVFTYGR